MDTSDIPENIRRAFGHDSSMLRRISERIRKQRRRAAEAKAEAENRMEHGGHFITPTDPQQSKEVGPPQEKQLKLPL